MTKNTTEKQIVFLIKKLLKKHDYNYSDLAHVLELSEASVKRIMSQGDFSLKRLEKISEWFGLNFFDFLDKARSTQLEPYEFSIEQEKLFVAEPRLLYVMILLSVGFSIKDISISLGVDDITFHKMLLQLDKASLIELHENRKVKILARAPFKMKADGELKRIYYPQFFDKALACLQNYSDVDQVIVSEYYMSDSLLQEMRQEIQELHTKYMSLARMEQEVVDTENFKPVTEVIFNTNHNSWGEILNSLPK